MNSVLTIELERFFETEIRGENAYRDCQDEQSEWRKRFATGQDRCHSEEKPEQDFDFPIMQFHGRLAQQGESYQKQQQQGNAVQHRGEFALGFLGA